MGFSLGWVVIFAAGAIAAPPAEQKASQISYTVKMVEANGVGWRETVFNRLKPVARQGAATVWTLPKNAGKSLIQQITKDPAGRVLQSPRITAIAGAPATVQVRESRKFITQVAWNGDEPAATGAPEAIRVGWHTTVVGRKLDQGILVKMVIEDTEIRGVHKVYLNADEQARNRKSDASISGTLQGDCKTAEACATAFEGSPFESGSVPVDATKTSLKDLMDKAKIAFADGNYVECEAMAKRALEVDPNKLAASMLIFKARTERRFNHSGLDYATTHTDTMVNNRIAVEFPEIANQEVLGEWLIPNGECLLVSFGPHTVADKDGKAVVRERLAFVEAEENTDVTMNSTAPAPPSATPPPAAPTRRYMPSAPKDLKKSVENLLKESEASRQVVDDWAHFWLSDQPSDMTPFRVAGAPPYENSKPKPPLPPTQPLPSGRYMHDDVKYFPMGTDDFPWASTQSAEQRARMRTLQDSEPAPPVAPDAKLPTPPAPARSFPQGIHTDGSKAKLPPLPDDEMEDESSESESAEPLPSPQTKKPRNPKPEPARDTGTTKASFTQPKSSTVFLPSVFLPGASVGFQFLLPVKPLSLRLPFNQRLEIEIFGRVVPDIRVRDAAK